MEAGAGDGKALLRHDEADGDPIAIGEALVGDGTREPAHEKDAAPPGAKKILRHRRGEFLD